MKPTEKEQDEELILLHRTNREDAAPEDLKALRQYYVRNPPASLQTGIASFALENALNGARNGAVAEATRAGVGKLRAELGYRDSSALERMLIDHIALCWINVHRIQFDYDGVMSQSVTLKQGAYWERRLTSAQRRYLKAIETLARVRRMKLPAVQVNIGQNQMNVST